jgi:aryl-alcohol dehydrogenase-like predicted oxidoreductase
VLSAVEKLNPLAKETGLSMAQMALAWVLQNSSVSAAIIGASRPEQVVENAKASGIKLEEALLTAIDDVLQPVIQLDPAMTTSPERSTFN